jgi:hypothetical protein
VTGTVCTVIFGPAAIFSDSSSTSSPCFRRTRSGLHFRDEQTVAELVALVDAPRLATVDLAQERRRDVPDHRRSSQRVLAALHRGGGTGRPATRAAPVGVSG